ncbi:MAG TPA: hypothetical protein P5121_02080 [Caldilineaceae bacterium]|nr:hypothetical protein [Caldilineaceae bacterium]
MALIRTFRTPFFVVALLLMLAIVLIERSQVDPRWVDGLLRGFLPQTQASVDAFFDLFPPEQKAELDELMAEKADEAREKLTPDIEGFGIPTLQYVDGVLLFSLALIGLGLLLPATLQVKLQGCLTLIVGLVIFLIAIVLIFVVIAKLIVMVSLLLSFPFGTIAYFFIYADFPRDASLALLSFLFGLKLLVGLLLLLAHQRFLENLGLVLMVLTSLVANFIVSLLHGIVPGFLVSITDAIAGIVVLIIAIIWAIVLIIGAAIALITLLLGFIGGGAGRVTTLLPGRR